MNLQDQRTMLILGQLFMLVLAVILALAPRLYLVAIIVYMAVIFALSARSRGGAARVSKEEIEKARTLFKEDKAFDLAVEDEEYVKEVSRQAKAMMIPLLLFPVYIVVFRMAGSIQPVVHKLIYGSLEAGDTRISWLITWVIVFESLFLLNQLVRKLTAGGQVQAPMVPNAYRVTDKGIVFKGGLGRVLGFPLPEGTKIEVNEARGFVEIRMPRGGRIRLYTKKPRKLYEVITRYGLRRGRGKEEGGSSS